MATRIETRPVPATARPRWWRRPWIVPLALAVAAFLAYSLPPYLTLDPAKARVPQPPGFAAHYEFLLAHILFGTIALVGVVLQVWPWLRKTHPVLHRRIGRIYLFGGALPSAVMAAVIGAMSPFGPVVGTLDVVGAVLWFSFAVAGWRSARQRRFADHRKWMIRTFAMTANTLVTRVYAPLCFFLILPRVGGDPEKALQLAPALSAALTLTTLLLLSQWWIDRKPSKRRPVSSGPSSRSSSDAESARSVSEPASR